MTATVGVTAFYEHPPKTGKQTRYEVWCAVQSPEPGYEREFCFDVFNTIHAMAFGRAHETGRVLRVTYHDSQHWREVDRVEFVEPGHAN